MLYSPPQPPGSAPPRPGWLAPPISDTVGIEQGRRQPTGVFSRAPRTYSDVLVNLMGHEMERTHQSSGRPWGHGSEASQLSGAPWHGAAQ